MAVVGASGLLCLRTALFSQYFRIGTSFATNSEAGRTSLYSIYLLDTTPLSSLEGS